MSSLAGPSSHSYSSFSAHSQQPPVISTKLRRVADVESTSSSAVTPATAPPTPVARAQSVAETEGREQSQDRQVNGTPHHEAGASNGVEQKRPQDLKASIIADLDAVRARAIARSRQQGRTIEEEAAMAHTAARIASQLAEDQRAALFPDLETPFVDQVDVVKRLLPYHIFQQPKEDLDAILRSESIHPSRKGKRKATEEDLLREEIAGASFALDCWRRRRALEERFRKARIESGKRASPDDQSYVLAQALLEVERAETAALQQELRAARQELDKIEREKRLAAPPPPPPVPAAQRPTMNVRTANYYNPSAASTPTQTPTTATFMPPYRPYTYSYSQYPTTQYTYNPHAYGATPYTSTASNPYGTPSASATTTPTTPAYTSAASAATTTPTSVASAQVQQAQAHPSSASNTAVPVQLPVSSLNALSALGIVPIAAAAVPPTGPQPPAVIKSTNGSILNLEINLSLLQSAQMSGLALILNALTSRGVNVDGSFGGAASAAPSATTTTASTQSTVATTNGAAGASTPATAAAVNGTSPASTTATPSYATPSASVKGGVPSASAAVQADTSGPTPATSAAPSAPASTASTSSSTVASAAPPPT
ncbi:hypothetical protein OH77DRAFT_1402512 [Trametes cingulata]|nr:hypothetical protein OH77DRAFT_1402512 [Trametes cingulata]